MQISETRKGNMPGEKPEALVWPRAPGRLRRALLKKFPTAPHKLSLPSSSSCR